MVICKFFQQGNCRFGSNCRFEHSYHSKYSYHAQQSSVPQAQPQAGGGGVTDEQLMNQVRADVISALKGNQWILSSYAPFKEKPTLPGIPDLSPEEARLFIYEAKANNNIEQAVAHINNLLKQSRLKYEQLLQPTPAITNTLRRLYHGETVSSPFSTQSGFGPTNSGTSSVFRSAVQNTSVFGQSGATSNTAASIFGQAANNVFGASSGNAKSIFAQATQNVFAPAQLQAPSPFGTSPDPAKSIFAQANQSVSPQQNVFQPAPQQTNSANIFASASQQFFGKPAEPFAQPASDPFGQNQTFGPPPTQNVFQRAEQPTNVFATNVFEQPSSNANDGGIYSIENELTETDLQAFQSPTFKLGFIPEIPPPRSLVYT